MEGRPAMNPTAIEVRNLTKQYRDVVAVDHLSFEVAPGTVTGFLGPNGAGKTTTLRMLLGLAAPSDGTALIEGKPYADLAPPTSVVGAVLDTAVFHPGRRARDHLRVVAAASAIPATRVDQVLAEVDLSDAASRRVRTFSLGMRQRLALATALLARPRVLILDEPANGLDPRGVHWLRSFLRRFADDGGTVFVSSHLLAELALTVDDVVVIAHGRLITHASLADLTRRATPAIRVRVPNAARLRELLTARGMTAQCRADDELVALDTTSEQVGGIAVAAGIPIYELTAERLDLEEIFLELTSGGDRR
jgi:ABC-2 type transport system ATP-binding protein